MDVRIICMSAASASSFGPILQYRPTLQNLPLSPPGPTLSDVLHVSAPLGVPARRRGGRAYLAVGPRRPRPQDARQRGVPGREGRLAHGVPAARGRQERGAGLLGRHEVPVLGALAPRLLPQPQPRLRGGGRAHPRQDPLLHGRPGHRGGGQGGQHQRGEAGGELGGRKRRREHLRRRLPAAVRGGRGEGPGEGPGRLLRQGRREVGARGQRQVALAPAVPGLRGLQGTCSGRGRPLEERAA
mmetsp:Transcript_28880/g.85778  ORF Transcript_28880/g.85778 Transcript_28880/m.85778 type:complete len:242 (+) Transcript_28880:3-728(+)